MPPRPAGSPPDPLAARSALFCAAFHWYNTRLLRRSFTALRQLKGHAAPAASGPLVVYSNHPGWWDPLVLLWLARQAYPATPVYGPIAAAQLARYGFFRKLGLFGVREGPAGAADFLNAATAALGPKQGMLWLTAEGSFRDPRVRPLRLRPGLAHLIKSFPDLTYVPLAVEYPFGPEPRPEIRVAFGAPVRAASTNKTAVLTQLTAALEQTQDTLAHASMTHSHQDPQLAFETLWEGRQGLGGLYDFWRSLRSKLMGQRMSLRHNEASTQ